MRVYIRFLLFVSSFAPGLGIIAILQWAEHRIIAYVAASLGVLGVAVLLFMLWHWRHDMGSREEKVEECRRQDAETITYVLSYLIPFVGGFLEGGDARIAFVVYFVVIGILYANSNLIHINPMLNLFGYRLYEVKLEDGGSYVLITRRKRVLPGQILNLTEIRDEILLEVKET